MRAYNQVRSNKGSAGVDGMSVYDLYDYLSKNRERIESELRNGKYLPQPILGVEIPKSNGKTRLLGIPTVVDRLLQQAVGQIIAIKFEMEFEDYSYGFRPNRNAQQAVLKAQQYINSGLNRIVDIDLKNFFDEVDHCILLQLLYRKIKCPLTLRLIRKWLKAPILINGKLTKRTKGVPQGSPLSPLLSNIMLNELDKEAGKQGLKYVRYADDFSIYTKTYSQAQRIMNSIGKFLNDKLKLPINLEKSGVRKPCNFTILGFDFVPLYLYVKHRNRLIRPLFRAFCQFLRFENFDPADQKTKCVCFRQASKNSKIYLYSSSSRSVLASCVRSLATRFRCNGKKSSQLELLQMLDTATALLLLIPPKD